MSQTFHRKPDLFEYSQSLDLFGHSLSFYLETNKRGEVSQLCFTYDGEEAIQKDLENFCQAIQGHVLGDLPSETINNQFPLIPLLYRKFVLDVKEEHISYAEQKGRDPQKLICRCFGVYEEDIHELVGSGIEVQSLRDLGDHLNAGVGCGTCHHDLKEVLNPLIPKPVSENAPEGLPLWQKLDPQGLANEVFQTLKKLNKENERGLEYKIKGTRPGGVLLGCESKQDISKEEATELVQKYIDEILGKGLDCIVTVKITS